MTYPTIYDAAALIFSALALWQAGRHASYDRRTALWSRIAGMAAKRGALQASFVAYDGGLKSYLREAERAASRATDIGDAEAKALCDFICNDIREMLAESEERQVSLEALERSFQIALSEQPRATSKLVAETLRAEAELDAIAPWLSAQVEVFLHRTNELRERLRTMQMRKSEHPSANEEAA